MWQAWTDYRKEKKNTLTNSTIKYQWNKLKGYPVEIAIAMIGQSIEHGWTGIFEIKQNGNGNGHKPPLPFANNPPAPKHVIPPEEMAEMRRRLAARDAWCLLHPGVEMPQDAGGGG